MSATGIYTVSSPTVGQEYIAPSGYWVIPTNGSNVTVEVKTYNSSGVLTAVSTLAATVRNVTAGNDNYTYTGSSIDDGSATSAGASNGTNVVTVAGTVGSACDHMTMQVTAYTGSPYIQVYVRRSSAWVTATSVAVRRSGSWAATSVYVRRSGAWVQIA